ncbi:sugar-transfer associated ATP-grasp domain-containing protein [Aliiruegeria sabulilitoris]|uniref:sugar-transfer associated ATP-grasp domain-containing protein n=1 Tax=Aliiruegeria sabulilitoris TaxID=1510458 RepID=UPI0013D4FE58|nr:sugar-transfer associated ATP-grasp domain-containing protein [Aliiruegeria sabulilitoris]
MHRLRVAGRRAQFANQPGWKRVVAKTAMTLLWPLGAATTALDARRYYGGTSVRMLDAWWLALRNNVPPLEYYLHRLWEPARRARLDDYLYWSENAASLLALNRAAGLQPGPSPVEDKHLFSTFCAGMDLPTPVVWGIWRMGQQDEGDTLPEQDLWLKPLQSKGAIGAECWCWRDGTFWREGRELTSPQMVEHIKSHSRSHGKTLVQTVIRAHPDHAPIIGKAPLCARILTGRHRDGTIEIVDAMAIWPREKSVLSQGGYMAMVDGTSGCIGMIYEAPKDCLARQMEGQVLPDWPVALAAVRDGHAALPHYVFLGWDVAFGENGPVLLETNSGWGSFHFQVLPDHPMGDTAFAEIAAEYV